MASITGPPAYLPGASVPPGRRRQYGLQTQATVTTEPDTARPRYSLQGVEHEVNDCGRLSCWSHDCDAQDGDKLADQPGQQWAISNPFTVVASGPACFGADAIANARRRALERLEALEWAAVERAVLSGMCGASPYLIGPPGGGGDIELEVRPATPDGYTALADWHLFSADLAPALPAGTDPVPLDRALALIEWGMRDYGGAGVIHAPSWTWPWLDDYLTEDGPRKTTEIGTGLAFGRGYWSVAPGTSDPVEPDTPPDTASAWLYATGAVRIWRSQPQAPTEDDIEFDWRRNRSTALVERHYTVSMQCPYIAVNAIMEDTPEGE